MARKVTRQAVQQRTEAQTERAKVLAKQVDYMVEQFGFMEPKEAIKFLGMVGVGTEFRDPVYMTCSWCGKLKRRDGSFYASTEPGNRSGIAPICRECANDIVYPVIDGVTHAPTKETLIRVLEFLRKPFFESVYQSSLTDVNNPDGASDIWKSYIRTIQLKCYYGRTYQDSDFFHQAELAEDAAEEYIKQDPTIVEAFEKNKADVIRLLGYDPFDEEKPADQPIAYSQLVGMLDSSENANEDMMKVASCISIVRSFIQVSRFDNMISEMTKDPQMSLNNANAIRTLQETKKSTVLSIAKLAQESCISLKHSRNASKGENTWTGKIKKIKDINLREGEVNGFDIATCRGMRQVIEMSDASIMKQLHLDESEWSDIVAEQRVFIRKLQDELMSATEISRIILRENLDLRDTLVKNELADEDAFVNLSQLYSDYAVETDVVLDDESDAEEVQDIEFTETEGEL